MKYFVQLHTIVLFSKFSWEFIISSNLTIFQLFDCLFEPNPASGIPQFAHRQWFFICLLTRLRCFNSTEMLSLSLTATAVFPVCKLLSQALHLSGDGAVYIRRPFIFYHAVFHYSNGILLFLFCQVFSVTVWPHQKVSIQITPRTPWEYLSGIPSGVPSGWF